MIRQAVPSEVLAFPRQDEAALRIGALIRDYGDAPFWRLYSGEDGSVAAIVGDRAVLCSGEDAEEMLLFLSMDPTVSAVRTDAATARLAAGYGFAQVSTGTLLRKNVAAAVSEETVELSPRRVWPLLSAVFGDVLPPFDVWYADVFHRFRHGSCHLCGVEREGTPVSVAMTVAETEGAALIGGVATAEAFRGCGFAASGVEALCRTLKKQGKQEILLAPKNESLIKWYATLGFVPCGTWGEASRL